MTDVFQHVEFLDSVFITHRVRCFRTLNDHLCTVVLLKFGAKPNIVTGTKLLATDQLVGKASVATGGFFGDV